MREKTFKNFETTDIYFEDYLNSAIMQIAIWLQRKEFMKRYPECSITTVHYHGFVRVIAFDPTMEEVISYTLKNSDFKNDSFSYRNVISFEESKRQLTQSFQSMYPNCEIAEELIPEGVRIVVYKNGTN